MFEEEIFVKLFDHELKLLEKDSEKTGSKFSDLMTDSFKEDDYAQDSN
jgi:hypothetical protein